MQIIFYFTETFETFTLQLLIVWPISVMTYGILYLRLQQNPLFFYSGSFSFDIYKSQTSRKAGRPILTPFYHIHPFHEHLNIRWAIIAERSSLHISSGRTPTGNLWFLSQVVNQIRFKYIRKMIDCSINEYYTDFIALQFSAHLKFADSDDQCAVITKWILAFNDGHASLQRTTFIKSPALRMKDLDMTKFNNWTALW